jgi:signal transduction histidine kinase
MTITDDGAGSADTTPNEGSAGGALRALACRADLIGATFNVERLATRGTRVTCVLPVTGTIHAAEN